jgi:hypothetical protein
VNAGLVGSNSIQVLIIPTLAISCGSSYYIEKDDKNLVTGRTQKL